MTGTWLLLLENEKRMNTSRNKRIPSPLQQVQQDRERAFNVGLADHPVREEIAKCLDTFQISATVEEDNQTLRTMKHVEGLIAFLCTLKQGSRVIAQGRGSSVLSPNNRYMQRAVRAAFNASLVDACIRGTKVLDTFMPDANTKVQVAAVETPRIEASREDQVTDRQLAYLRELIRVQVHDEEERERWESQLEELTKEEASELIASFKT